MEHRHLPDNIELVLGKLVWLSIFAGMIAAPSVVASHLLNGSPILTALLALGAMALVPAVPLLIAFALIAVRQVLLRSPLAALRPALRPALRLDQPDMTGPGTQLYCERR